MAQRWQTASCAPPIQGREFFGRSGHCWQSYTWLLLAFVGDRAMSGVPARGPQTRARVQLRLNLLLDIPTRPQSLFRPGVQEGGIPCSHVPFHADWLPGPVQMQQVSPGADLDDLGTGDRLPDLPFPLVDQLAGAEHQCTVGPTSGMSVDCRHAHDRLPVPISPTRRTDFCR